MQFLRLLLAIVLLAYVYQSVAAQAADDIKTVHLSENTNKEIVAAVLSGLKDGQLISLKLRFFSTGKTDEDSNFLRSEEGNRRRYRADCEVGNFGPLLYDDESEFFTQPSNHLSVTIFPGSRVHHPFNDVSCEYTAGHPDKAVVQLRGFYIVLTNSIPTAQDLQLRPINVPPQTASKFMMAPSE